MSRIQNRICFPIGAVFGVWVALALSPSLGLVHQSSKYKEVGWDGSSGLARVVRASGC